VGIAFVVRDVYGTPGAAQELRDLHVSRLPAFVIGDTVVEGFDRMAILHAHHVTGEIT